MGRRSALDGDAGVAATDAPPAAAFPADIRSRRPYLLSASPLRAIVRRVASAGALAFLDLSGVALGVYSGLVVREAVQGRFPPLWGLLWDSVADWLPLIGLVTVLVFWQAGLYASRELRAGVGRILPSLVVVAAITVAFAVGTGHDFNTFGLVPTALVLTTLFVGVLRGSYEAVTRDLLRLAGVRRRAVLVGETNHLWELRRTLGPGRGGIAYEFVGVLSPAGEEAAGLPVLGDLAALPGVLGRHDVDELIATGSDLDEQALLELVDVAHRGGVKVRVVPGTTELLRHRAEYLPGQGVPLFELRPPVFAGTEWVVKRAFDLSVSAAILVLGLPLWLLIALAIKLDSRGPVLYRDRRIGLNERAFHMFKLRTMHADAARLQPDLELANEADGPLFKIRDDPRVTRVGALLRRFSIDELPQVLNVLRGEMSLVGPRPLPVRDFARLESWHRKRYLVLPGMTGLWQISGRSQLSFDDLVRLDFYYLDNWSLWLDVAILAKTIPAVLAARGAY